MRKNRNQGMVILLILSLLTSMAPSSSVDASAEEDRVLENHVLAAESPVSIPAEVQEDVSEAGMDDLAETKKIDTTAGQGNTSNHSAEESDAQDNVPDPSTDGFVVSDRGSDPAANGGKHGNASVAAERVPDSGQMQSAGYRITSNTARSASDYMDLGNCGANLTWVLDNNGCLSITGEGDMTNFADVSAVPWFSYRSLINKVSFSGNITNIGAYAFDYCVNLTSITIPDSVVSIGAYSFYGCSGLKSISIPKNVTGIGAFAFSSCTGLTSVTISDHVTSIGASAFAGCTSLTSITIPDSVTSIGDDAFDNTGIDTDQIAFRRGSCGTSLKWELLGNHQLRIYGSGAMTDFSAGSAPWHKEREKIQEVILSDGVTRIGDYALDGCKTLTTITLPDTI
ncbi:MAG: leucine-rich repeat domain-containing protein, partial [Lachnospiraceae bacterium]|nr:leucine-rich repeat domain-containing protein [Lachnospiraceae bacterium]